MLALTLASPSACPMILHSKGRITYRPSLSEIFWSPDHAFDMDFSLNCHCNAEEHEYSLSDPRASTDPAVP